MRQGASSSKDQRNHLRRIAGPFAIFLKAEANQMLGKQESGKEVISINNRPEWKDDILFTSRTVTKSVQDQIALSLCKDIQLF